MTLLINSNKEVDFVDRDIKTPCLAILFPQFKVSLCERNTHDVSSLLAFLKIVVVSQHKRQRNSALCKWATRTCQTCLSNLLQTHQATRNNKKLSKQVLVMIKHCLGNSKINSMYRSKEFSFVQRVSPEKLFTQAVGEKNPCELKIHPHHFSNGPSLIGPVTTCVTKATVAFVASTNPDVHFKWSISSDSKVQTSIKHETEVKPIHRKTWFHSSLSCSSR